MECGCLLIFVWVDSNSNTASIRQINHFKSLFVSMLQPLLLTINFDIVSSFNVFNSLIFMFLSKG